MSRVSPQACPACDAAQPVDAALAFRDETRKDIALVALTDRPEVLEGLREDAREAAHRFQTRVRFLAGEHWDVDVTGYAFLVDDVARFGVNGRGDVAELEARCTAENPDQDHVYWHICGVWTGSGNAGVAGLDTNVARTYAINNTPTHVHEFGHNCGMGHDDANTLMSASRRKYLSAGGMQFIGLIDPDHAVYLPGAARVFLVPPETRDEAVGNTEHKIAYLAGDKFAVAAYDGHAMIFTSIATVKDDDDVPRADGDPGAGPRQTPWSTIRQRAMLREPGDSWGDVTFHGWHEGAAEVTIGDAPQRPHAPLDLPAGTDVAPGIWHDPRYTHQGLDIRVNKHGTVAVYWYTWKGERPYWLVAEGPVIDGRAELTIHAPYALRGERRLREAGRAVLAFDGPNVATMRYNAQIDDWFWTGRGQLNLDRIDSPEDDPLTGAYAFEGVDHEGVTVSVIGAREVDGEALPERVIAYWFAWEWERGVLYPTWYYGHGPRRGDLTLQRPVNGAHLVETDSYLEDETTAKIYRTAFRCPDKDARHKLERLA